MYCCGKPVAVCERVPEGVSVAEGVCVCEALGDGVAVPLPLGLPDALGVPEALRLPDTVTLGVPLPLPRCDGVPEPVPLGLCVRLGETLGVCVSVWLGEGEQTFLRPVRRRAGRAVPGAAAAHVAPLSALVHAPRKAAASPMGVVLAPAPTPAVCQATGAETATTSA